VNKSEKAALFFHVCKCTGARVDHPLTHGPRHLAKFVELGFEIVEPAKYMPLELVHLK
jgi:hypothetical protein